MLSIRNIKQKATCYLRMYGGECEVYVAWLPSYCTNTGQCVATATLVAAQATRDTSYECASCDLT